MRLSATIFHNDCCYEIRFEGTKVFQIRRYVGEEQREESLLWDQVPQEVKKLIIDEVKQNLPK